MSEQEQHFDAFARMRQAMDSRTAAHLSRVHRAFSLFCREQLPPRFAVILVNELLREQLDRLDEGPKRPGRDPRQACRSLAQK